MAGATESGATESAAAEGEPAVGWWLYVLRCGDGSLYAGITTHLPRRVEQHNGALPGGARYTRSRRPVVLVHAEPHADRAAAARAELAFKRLRRAAKLARCALRPGAVR
jgi:putative endonuclease